MDSSCWSCGKAFLHGVSLLADVSPLPSDRKRIPGEYCRDCAPEAVADVMSHPDFRLVLIRKLSAPTPQKGILEVFAGFLRGLGK